MLPILFKLSLDSAPSIALFVAAALASIGFQARQGWHAGRTGSAAVMGMIAYATGTALVACVGAIFVAPPFSPTATRAMTIALWSLAAGLSVSSALLGRFRAQPGNRLHSTLTHGAAGVGLSWVALHFASGGPMGHDLGLPLHTYGLMMATAFAVAISIAGRRALKAFPEQVVVDGRSSPAGPVMRDHVFAMAMWILVAALAGSRVLYVFTTWDDYRADWNRIFSLGGGLVFYGGFIAAVIAALAYTKLHNLPFLRIADVMIPSVAIGHAIGRLGCLSAGCCWGGIAKAGSHLAMRFPSASHLPFGGFGTDSLAFQEQARDPRWVDGLGHLYDHAVAGAQQISAYANSTGFTLPVYPTQLMESAGELLLFLTLLLMTSRKRFQGQLLGVWLVGYAILRTSVELFRGDDIRGFLFRYPAVDPWMLSTSQAISAAILLAGIAVLALGRSARQQVPQLMHA